MTRSLPAPSRDVALLVARLVMAVVLFAHGWQKLVLNGISDTAVLFHNFGIPLAIVASSFTVCVEFVGGTLLLLGVLVPVASAFITFVMVGAIFFVHGPHGIFATNGGWELVAVIAAGVLAIAAFGPGRFSVDHLLHSRKAPEPAPVPIRSRATSGRSRSPGSADIGLVASVLGHRVQVASRPGVAAVGPDSLGAALVQRSSIGGSLSMFRSLPGTTRDVALLAARVVLGVILIAHGWQKLVTNGMGATTHAFAGMGVPLAPLSAVFAMAVELVGGLLLVAGAATVIVGILVVLDMLGALLLVHIGNGIFATNGGWELVGVIAAAALALAAAGAGRFSIDHAVSFRRRPAHATSSV